MELAGASYGIVPVLGSDGGVKMKKKWIGGTAALHFLLVQ